MRPRSPALVLAAGALGVVLAGCGAGGDADEPAAGGSAAARR